MTHALWLLKIFHLHFLLFGYHIEVKENVLIQMDPFVSLISLVSLVCTHNENFPAVCLHKSESKISLLNHSCIYVVVCTIDNEL